MLFAISGGCVTTSEPPKKTVELVKPAESKSVPPPSKVTLPPQPPQPFDVGPPPFVGPPPGSEEVQTDNNTLLSEAQTLADQGQYLAAIRRLDKVTFPTAERDKADQKTKDYSAAAVQELRRKAAQAFQTARPAIDKATRLRYLEEAKRYLDEAIKNYPDAPQLPTVRENLSLILQEIERTESMPSR